jgi:DNA-binding winged helix-turn-helix (wHTH) protein
MIRFRFQALMPDAAQALTVRRFGAFEINLQSGELRKNGMRLRLSGQPFHVLVALVQSPGEMVTREELHSKLWPADTFVDFDHGLNNAVARIREVLDDSSETPRYVETIPRRGYRFIAPINSNVQKQSPTLSRKSKIAIIGGKPFFFARWSLACFCVKGRRDG